MLKEIVRLASVQSSKDILQEGGRGLQERSIQESNRAARVFIMRKICKMYLERHLIDPWHIGRKQRNVPRN